jgi:hypothetical protein
MVHVAEDGLKPDEREDASAQYRVCSPNTLIPLLGMSAKAYPQVSPKLEVETHEAQFSCQVESDDKACGE